MATTNSASVLPFSKVYTVGARSRAEAMARLISTKKQGDDVLDACTKSLDAARTRVRAAPAVLDTASMRSGLYDMIDGVLTFAKRTKSSLPKSEHIDDLFRNKVALVARQTEDAVRMSDQLIGSWKNKGDLDLVDAFLTGVEFAVTHLRGVPVKIVQTAAQIAAAAGRGLFGSYAAPVAVGIGAVLAVSLYKKSGIGT